ncbi:cytochrome P450 [Penicillium brevicompactum]
MWEIYKTAIMFEELPFAFSFLPGSNYKPIRDVAANDMASFMAFAIVCTTTFVVVLSLYLLAQSRIKTQRVPSSIGHVGLRNEAFGTVRACIREFTSGLQTMASGYKKFSEKGEPFIMPTSSFETHIMLPREYIKWLTDQPEDILSHGKVHGEKLGLRYLFPGFDYTTDMAIATAIRLHLTRNLATIQDDLMDEIQSQSLHIDEFHRIPIKWDSIFWTVSQLQREIYAIYEAPEDLITWMLRAALDTKAASIEDPGPLTSGAISSSSVTVTNMLLDILSSDPKLHYYQTLREEAESVFPATGDQKRPSASLKLHRMDSAIRESLRRNPIHVRGLWREVVPKNGITLPDGQHLQQGAWLSVPIPGIHNDDRFYPDSEAYNPFRFVPGSFSDVETAKEKIADAKNCKPVMLTMTSDTFLPFGHARHSCPGRWFASHHIKLVLAYIFLHYDIQGMPERPLNHVWGEHPIPPPGTVIKVKRRAVG